MDMKKVESGVLAGVDIPAEKAREVSKVASVEKAIEVMREAEDHTATESTLEALMGVETRPVEVFGNYKTPEDERGTVLSGVQIGEAQNEAMDDVADAIEAIKDAHSAQGALEQSEAAQLGDTLSAAMGVQ